MKRIADRGRRAVSAKACMPGSRPQRGLLKAADSSRIKRKSDRPGMAAGLLAITTTGFVPPPQPRDLFEHLPNQFQSIFALAKRRQIYTLVVVRAFHELRGLVLPARRFDFRTAF